MIVMVVVGLIVSANVDHQTGGVVSYNVEELSLKLELVHLVLSVSPRQHGDDSVHFPHPRRHLSLPPWVRLQGKFVGLKERRNLQTLAAVYTGKVRIVTEGLCYSEGNQRFIEIENRLRCEGRNLQFKLMGDEWFEQFIPGSLVQFLLKFIQATCNISRLERPDIAYLKKYNYL